MRRFGFALGLGALLSFGAGWANAQGTPANPNTAIDAVAAKLERAPAGAQTWFITSTGGRHGQSLRWTDAKGVRHSRESLNLRGLRNEVDQQMRLGADGATQMLTSHGVNPQGDASEHFALVKDKARYASQVDHGEVAAKPGAVYVPFGGTLDGNIALFDALMRSPINGVDLLPGGHATVDPLTTATVSDGKTKKLLTAYAVSGLGLSPFPVWAEGKTFFGVTLGLNFLPPGWEVAAEALTKAQDAALAKRAPALVEQIAKAPGRPVAFTDVKLYDSEARTFREHMTVVVDAGRILSVGPAAAALVPQSSRVFEGKGKTLLPGLWDCHQHYGDDGTGPLLLSMGVTSVRDPGNTPETSIARVKRIESGQLLGPHVTPMMLIDGPGPLSAQVAVVVKTQAEAIAAVDRAHTMGFAGVKLYGSLDPALVKPIADRAHGYRMRVQGHIPRTMRPIEAVRAGYDEITHINMVMMQFMPDSVVNASNGLARFYGPARYAGDLDLKSPAAVAYLDELKARGTAVDATLAIFETGFGTAPDELSPAYTPWQGIVPPAVERGLRGGGFAELPDLKRAQMKRSFAKLQALVVELNRRGIPVLAGTDGSGIELIRDLELYVAGGMSPADALATATINPARAFRQDKEIGSITPGKRADLVLVDGDPSQHMGDLRHTEWVMQGDRVMDAAALRTAAGVTAMPGVDRTAVVAATQGAPVAAAPYAGPARAYRGGRQARAPRAPHAYRAPKAHAPKAPRYR